MISYMFTTLRSNFVRFAATGIAVIVGVGFLSAGLMLTDAMRDGITGDTTYRYENVDLAVVTNLAGFEIGLDQGFTIPVETLDEIRDVPGVEAAEGEFNAPVHVRNDNGEIISLRTQGRLWIDADGLNPFTLIDGQAPSSANEVVLDEDLAKRSGVGIGDQVTLRTPVGEVTQEVSGLVNFRNRSSFDDSGSVLFSQEHGLDVLAPDTPGYGTILIVTSGDAGAVQPQVDALIANSLQVQTGQEFIDLALSMSESFISFLRPILQGFAFLSLFVCGFVIFNTFSVIVVQRMQELALVRAIGATPGQVRRSLLAEGLLIGLSASILGLGAGVAISYLLQVVLRQFEIHLPGAGIKITVGTVILSLLAGIIVTVISVLVPAFRAGRTKPVEAMRSSAVDSSGTSKVRAVFGAGFLILTALLLGFNQLVDTNWWALSFGVLFFFIGVLIGGPLLARLFGKLMAWPMSIFGLTGRLAADNSARNPNRTSTTANALVIGLFLVTLVTAGGEAAKSAVIQELNKLSSADYVITSMAAIDQSVLDGINDIEGVHSTAPIRSAILVDEWQNPVVVTTTDFDALEETIGFSITSGSLDGVLDNTGMAVLDETSITGGLEPTGDPSNNDAHLRYGPVSIVGINGDVHTIEPVAGYEFSLDSVFLAYLVGPELHAELAGDRPVNQIFVRTEPDMVDPVGVEIDELISSYSGIQLEPGNVIGRVVAQLFDFMIGAVNALLGMSVIIALVGIINTMLLSIHERTREIGMIRALGMTRAQVRRMIMAEAMLMGLLGTIIGVGSGILVAWIFISSFGGGEIAMSFNWARMGAIVAVGLFVGLFASLIPMRQATRHEPVEAMRAP